MVLNRKAVEALEFQPLNGPIVEVHMGYSCDFAIDGAFVHSKSVVLGGDLYEACGGIFHRLIGSAMADQHLPNGNLLRKSHKLVSEADAKHRFSG